MKHYWVLLNSQYVNILRQSETKLIVACVLLFELSFIISWKIFLKKIDTAFSWLNVFLNISFKKILHDKYLFALLYTKEVQCINFKYQFRGWWVTSLVLYKYFKVKFHKRIDTFISNFYVNTMDVL